MCGERASVRPGALILRPPQSTLPRHQIAMERVRYPVRHHRPPHELGAAFQNVRLFVGRKASAFSVASVSVLDRTCMKRWQFGHTKQKSASVV
jgi:hypothetical protein